MSQSSNRYQRLIEATLQGAMADRAKSASSNSVAIALPFVQQVLGRPAALVTAIDSSTLLQSRLVDGFGHSRPLYRGLVLYAMGSLANADPSLLREFAKMRIDRFEVFLKSQTALPASESLRLIELAFDALAVAAAPSLEPDVTLPAHRVLERFAALLQPDGHFFALVASDNPEPTWYHELAMLHAVTSFACRTGNRDTLRTVQRAEQYQSEQIQPDHASSHPLAIHAFLRSDNGTYLADMMLHAAGVQQPSRMDAVSLLLLADALDCMRLPVWRE